MLANSMLWHSDDGGGDGGGQKARATILFVQTKVIV